MLALLFWVLSRDRERPRRSPETARPPVIFLLVVVGGGGVGGLGIVTVMLVSGVRAVLRGGSL